MMKMANTSRESTASFLSGLIHFSASTYSHRISTAADPACQEVNLVALPIGEPLLYCILRAVQTTIELHSGSNGATVSLSKGNMVGRKLFAVSIYPERAIELTARPSWRQLFVFVLANLDLLLKPGRALGTWFDDLQGVHVLDVVICLSDRDTALALGLRSHQRSIFDLAASRAIRIGEPVSVLRPTYTEARP
jgi:hypothetical protein